ncbi:hypothetical protein [Cellulosilyticum sp. I15G10I2]|uniref:hypothetical protein n=1 Tax=Cellulosilyticum sp. I15G10I2 TaxID=1892843 RepID=UPI00085C4557|nr:hypothetical protein [Cellulosilyticum sp. I15G10I2]
MEKKICPTCKSELTIEPVDSGFMNGNKPLPEGREYTTITAFNCENHGTIEIAGIPFEEAQLKYGK